MKKFEKIASNVIVYILITGFVALLLSLLAIILLGLFSIVSTLAGSLF